MQLEGSVLKSWIFQLCRLLHGMWWYWAAQAGKRNHSLFPILFFFLFNHLELIFSWDIIHSNFNCILCQDIFSLGISLDCTGEEMPTVTAHSTSCTKNSRDDNTAQSSLLDKLEEYKDLLHECIRRNGAKWVIKYKACQKWNGKKVKWTSTLFQKRPW